MPILRFPSTGQEYTAAQLKQENVQIPTQVYIVLLNDSDSIGDDYDILMKSFNSHWGSPWEHNKMFGGKILSGTLDQPQVAWLLANDSGFIKIIEADSEVGIA